MVEIERKIGDLQNTKLHLIIYLLFNSEIIPLKSGPDSPRLSSPQENFRPTNSSLELGSTDTSNSSDSIIKKVIINFLKYLVNYGILLIFLG